jgi:hypothetical protein
MVAVFIITLFSLLSFELAHTRSLSNTECNTACLNHSQAGSILTNVNRLKKTDNEPRPPIFPQADTNLAVFLTILGILLGVLGWVNWYNRRMLISTQLRY